MTSTDIFMVFSAAAHVATFVALVGRQSERDTKRLDDDVAAIDGRVSELTSICVKNSELTVKTLNIVQGLLRKVGP